MKVISLFLFLISTLTFAQSNPDIKKLATIDLGGNGSQCFLSKFDVRKFNFKKEARKFYTTNSHADSRMSIFYKWSEVTNVIEKFLDNSSDWSETLYRLMKQKKVKAMFAAEPDQDICTESEYCSLGEVKIYFTTGDLLDCSFDQTT
jgi:hypothetical protein